jgi:hypothetical protein
MNTLSKKQKDEYATAFAMLALYDGGVSCQCMRESEGIARLLLWERGLGPIIQILFRQEISMLIACHLSIRFTCVFRPIALPTKLTRFSKRPATPR